MSYLDHELRSCWIRAALADDDDFEPVMVVVPPAEWTELLSEFRPELVGIELVRDVHWSGSRVLDRRAAAEYRQARWRKVS